ncbi:hypothetical protein [Peribacillus butanolivorans]
MKVVFQAFIGSIILHVFYFVSTMIVGSIKTSQYKPGIENAWGQAETLQNEVVFGKFIFPSVYLLLLYFPIKKSLRRDSSINMKSQQRFLSIVYTQKEDIR